MNNKSMLWEYIRLHRKSAFLLAVATAVFMIVFYLYRLPVEAVLYAGALTIAVALVIIIRDYRKFCKKHAELQMLLKTITLVSDKPPKAGDIIEEDYHELIDALHDELSELTLKADAIQRDMTEYYTLWAHQVKTPIAAMRLILQTEKLEDSELSDQLFKVEQYVEMVLTYLRAEGISSDLVLKKCELDPIIRASVRKFAKSFIRKRISLNYSGTDKVVLTDEKWLGFVIDQLISNSLKYTNSGAITIKVEGDELIISDTGIGIAPEDLPRIFEKGYTGYNGRLGRKSSGIGLFLSKKIVKKLSHTLEITSEKGAGTTAVVWLGSVDLKPE